MTTAIETAGAVVVTGIGATVFLDLCTILRARVFSEMPPDWGMVGRWVGHLPRGQLTHENIRASQPIALERPLGWAFHYVVGIALAFGLFLVAGAEWFAAPRILPALGYGLITVVLPWITTHPGLGMGIAASRLPKPWAARLRSLISHGLFGLGLFCAALIWQAIWSV